MKIVIIGGGVQGLACGYALAKRGLRQITILEATRIGYGASGRNSGGIRVQWRNAPNIRLAQRSMALYERLTVELDHQILLHRGGYLYLHASDEAAAQAERDVELQNSLGVPSRLISPRQATKILPHLNPIAFKIAQYHSGDATCHHDALLWGYKEKLRKLGVQIEEGMRVTALVKDGNRIAGVAIGDEVRRADHVIVAAGIWTRELVQTVGVEVPTNPWRRQQLVTEPVRHFMDPYVVSSQISFHQTRRGEVLGNAHIPVPKSSRNWNATRPLLETWCREIYHLFPPLGAISVIRQWAGSRDFSPDGTPIFGPAPEVENLWLICGQSGTGLMIAPAVADAIAAAIDDYDPRIDWDVYSPTRFARGAELWERSPSH